MSDSIREALAEGTQVLQSAGITDPQMDAVLLLTHALGVDRTFVIINPTNELSEEQIRMFRELIARRSRREPLQYIVGQREFYELSFEVTQAVLIPRPETEIIVDAALDLMKDVPAPFIADIGTGSGCIVISLLHRLRDAHAIATDISANALRVARRNARRHGVSDRLALIQSDLFSAFETRAEFSLIVSNPPYVPEADIETLQPEVRDYEPLPALVAGADGLSHISVLLRDLPPFLLDSGYLIFEIGFGQRDAVRELIDSAVWKLIDIRNDLQAIPRTFVLQKR